MTPKAPDIQLPHFLLQSNPEDPAPLTREDGLNLSGFSLSHANFTQPIHVHQTDTLLIVIVGHPIHTNQIDKQTVIEHIQQRRDDSAFYRSLNGEFLIICFNKKQKTLQVTTDRFASIPFYYAQHQSTLIGSIYYNDLWLWQRDNNHLKMNTSAFFEFLWLQRLLGSKTYDTASTFLPAATQLVYDREGTQQTTYWSPSFKKTNHSLKDSAAQLGEHLKTSILRKTSDGVEKRGLFLSGGRDSRSILAAFDRPPTCFTISVSKNNEYQIARQIALLQQSEHVYLPLEADPYSRHLDEMIQLGGGMHVFDHAIFAGFKNQVAPLADVVFHGHGLDYMFQGMYVPTNRIRLGKRNTSFYTLRPLADNMALDFLHHIPYRLKGIDLFTIIKKEQQSTLYEALTHSVQQVLDQGRTFCNSPYDSWEYLLMHALSRHYPHTNLDSMGLCTQQRTVTFDNDIFDLYLSLPPKYRLNARIARQTLKYLNPQLAKHPTGNTNARADQSPFQVEISRGWDSLLRKMRLRKKTIFWTPAEERTWPDRDRLLCSQPKLQQYATDLRHSEALDSLGFINMDALSNYVPQWLEKPIGGGALLCFLITLDRFLKQ